MILLLKKLKHFIYQKFFQKNDNYQPAFPAGHFYSPLPDLAEVRRDRERIFGRPELAAIDLKAEQQMELLEKFKEYYPQIPFPALADKESRYFFENPSYSYSDAIMLYSMIRYLSPARIIEIGSGYSSALMMDVNERFFANNIELVFIEPHPELLLSLLRKSDQGKYELLDKRLQDVDLDIFAKLGEGDILFIDSTHVAKTGSDVNMIIHQLLPRLRPGVHIHVHDIFYPFEYPENWVMAGRAWNEAYMLRAFLQYNESFQIKMFNVFMEESHEDWFRTNMPLCLKNPGGSIWLEKIK